MRKGIKIKSRKSLGQKVFTIANYTFFILAGLVTLYPFWYTLMSSIVPLSYFATHPLLLYPGEITWEGYRLIFSAPTILNGYKITGFSTIVGTILSMLFSVMGAYVMSEKELPGRNIITQLIIFTMFFSGGLIPIYINLNNLGLINNIWVYIFPSLINTFYLIILKTNFQNMPKGLKDAARIDGCNDFGILFRITIPLSTPVLATIALFYAVDKWNDFFTAIFFVHDSSKYTLQAVLHNMISKASANSKNVAGMGMRGVSSDQVKYAAIMAATIPILLVYPYLQRYFVKGVMIGAVKG